MTDVDLIHIYEESGGIDRIPDANSASNDVNNQKNVENDLTLNRNNSNIFDINSFVLSHNDNESDILNNTNSKSFNHNISNDYNSDRQELSSIITATNGFERLSRQYSLTFSSRSQSIIRNRQNNNNRNNNNNANVNLSTRTTVNSINNNHHHNIDDTSSINSVSMNLSANEPIIIRGDGNITIFGIFNRFSKDFPTKLAAKLAPEEYRDTITKVNIILKKELSNSLKWLIFGSICCCCTFGCSLIPVFYINKKAKLAINKLLNLENERIYKKLGIKWRLAKQKFNSGSLLEYVIIIDIIPSLLIYEPD